MSPARVLHVISEMGTGGAESLVVEMVRRGRAVGWTSAVATSGGRRADELSRDGVEIHQVQLPRRSARGLVRAARDTYRAVRRFAPDALIAHNVSASAVGRAAVLGTRVPVITVFHGVATADYVTSARVLRRTSTGLVAVSEAIRDRLCAAGLRGPAPVVIRNAVSVPSGSPDRAEIRRGLGIAEDEPVALCLARMVPQKRHDVLIDAWAMRRGPGTLLLAGDGPLRAELEERTRILGVHEQVRFLGTRADVDRLLIATDVTVLTSDWEGLPIAVLESLGAGRPVIATDVDGLREVLGGGGGRLVPTGDPASVAGALAALLADPALRTAMATAGHETLARHYDPGKMMMEYDAVLQRHMEESWR